MPHLTDLIWLVLIFALMLATAWSGRRTRLGSSFARTACERPRLVLAVLGVVYTAIVLQWSARNGRLAADPQWDDVVYLLDARQRLATFDHQGLVKVIKSFWRFPPHSPWSSAAALFAFVFLGAHVWAPYVVNVVLIIGLSLGLYALLPAAVLPAGERLFLSALPLLLPVTVRLIEEFRPDPALAVATAAFCLGLLKLSFFSPGIASRWRAQFRFGLVAGLALLIKPSFLYHTLVIMVLTQACSAMAIYLRTGQRPIARPRPGGALAFFGGALLVAGWYYVRALPQTLRYIHENTANNQDVELRRLHANTLGVLKNFFINGEMARMLGPFLLIFSVVVALGLIHFLRHRRWSDAGYLASVLICATASLSILAYVRLDNPFFHIFWELCLVAAGLHVVAQVRASEPSGWWIISGFAVLVIGTFLVHSPFAQFYPQSLDAYADQSLNRAIVLEIGQAWAENGDGGRRPARVQVCFTGPINHDAQQWRAEELRYPLEFGSTIEARNVEAEVRSLVGADFAEVADPASKWLYRWLPSGSFQSELLQRLRVDPSFSELPPVSGREGKVYLFRRSDGS